MLVQLDTPYADTTAGDLCFALGLSRQPALHVLELADARLQLRLLGASHQVVYADRWIETVACLPGRRAGLPPTVTDQGYRFTADVHRLDAAEMSRTVAGLRERLADDPAALIGVFPGSPDAVTALVAGPTGNGTGTVWRTWHAYPQSGELVITRTEVDR